MAERLVILGGGESGTGAALLAKQKGYDVFVSDQSQLKDKYKLELTQHQIVFEEGTHTESSILNAKLIIKSPGIPDKAEIIKKAKAAGIEIIDEIEFASRYTTAKLIAITGTNGKTTTTLLTYHLLKEAGYNVGLAGNVGHSMARQVANQSFDWFVIEMSSFQLDGTKTFSPEIAILLNITPDHLDRYEYTMQKYVDSKMQIIQSMKPSQCFIYYAEDAYIMEEVRKRTVAPKQVRITLKDEASCDAYCKGTVMHFNMNAPFVIDQKNTTLNGPHNLINTMAAVSAAQYAAVSVASIESSLKTFKNAPHRLESVAIINGVEFVNDSKATNVDSVVYALGSYTKPLVWIAGGVDKGNDYSLISDQVSKKVKALICLGKENDKLKKAFGNIVPVVKETQSVSELVRMALQLAQAGDVVLLSPACASFDLFKNYEDRGDQFRSAVLQLRDEVKGI